MDRRIRKHEAATRQQDAIEGFHERRIECNLRGQHSNILDVIVHGAVGASAHHVRRIGPFDLQHEVQLWWEHFTAVQEPYERRCHQDLLEMTFRQRSRKVRNLVDLEALVGLVDPPFARLQERVQVHRPRIVVDVVASLTVSKKLDSLDQARWVAHDRVEIIRRIVVHEAESYLDRVGVQPVAASRQRNARHPACGRRESAETARVELDVFSCYDVGRVARPHLII